MLEWTLFYVVSKFHISLLSDKSKISFLKLTLFKATLLIEWTSGSLANKKTLIKGKEKLSEENIIARKIADRRGNS